MKHLRSISELGTDGVARILKLTESMAEINTRSVPKVPALRGKTVVSLFFEDSTRTRLSFETAAVGRDNEFQCFYIECQQGRKFARHN